DTDLRVRHAEQLDELAPREVGHRDHTSRRAENGGYDTRTVRARPAVERFRVPEHGEVVHPDGERHARAERAAVGRAMQDIGGALASEQGRVPDAVPRKCRESTPASERAG